MLTIGSLNSVTEWHTIKPGSLPISSVKKTIFQFSLHSKAHKHTGFGLARQPVNESR
jgi:hypothetical protein